MEHSPGSHASKLGRSSGEGEGRDGVVQAGGHFGQRDASIALVTEGWYKTSSCDHMPGHRSRGQ